MAILAQIGPVLLAVTTSLHIDFLRKPAVTTSWLERQYSSSTKARGH